MNTFLRNRKSRQANNRLAPIRRSVGAAEDQIDEIDDETKSMEKEMIKMNRHNSMSKLKSTRALRNDVFDVLENIFRLEKNSRIFIFLEIFYLLRLN